MKKFGSVFALILISLALFTAQSFGVVSPPNWVNFQGFLTDNTGAPVADGTYDVEFRIYDAPAAGNLYWTEITTQNTSGGRFTHILGSVTPFSTDFFAALDSLYLEMTVEGEIISPRTPLTSVPYSKVADGLEMQGYYTNPGVAAMDTDPYDYWLRIYHDGGTLRAALGHYDFGILQLYDGSDALQIMLNSDVTGDGAALLPNGAISSPEILDEPGVVHHKILPFNNYNDIPVGINALDSISITVPTAGYVLVLGSLSAAISHTTGGEDEVYFQLMDTPGSISYGTSGFALYRVPGALPTATGPSDNYCQYLDLSRVFTVASAGTYKYFLNAEVNSGWDALDRFINAHLSAVFIPTAYGTVDLTASAAAENMSSGTGQVGGAPVTAIQSITMEEHNARLAAEVAQLKAEMQSRLEKLERRVNQPESGNPKK
ncbi:MAG: hypothetical protein L0Y74_03535 [candidate division Zixibacteria bacterium]|nr:hypothetical protein [candidate division Zixibacteria bacterium]